MITNELTQANGQMGLLSSEVLAPQSSSNHPERGDYLPPISSDELVNLSNKNYAAPWHCSIVVKGYNEWGIWGSWWVLLYQKESSGVIKVSICKCVQCMVWSPQSQSTSRSSRNTNNSDGNLWAKFHNDVNESCTKTLESNMLGLWRQSPGLGFCSWSLLWRDGGLSLGKVAISFCYKAQG